MDTKALSAYFAQLQQQLNPAMWTSEWMSHRIMNVECSISGNMLETVETCIVCTRDVMTVRELGDDRLLECLSASMASDELRARFMRAWNHPASFAEAKDLDQLAELAIYCFLHMLFEYER